MTVINDYAAAVPESLQFFTTYNLSCKASPWIPVEIVNSIKTGESVGLSLHFTTLIFLIHLACSRGMDMVVLVVFGCHPVTKWPAGAMMILLLFQYFVLFLSFKYSFC